LHTYGFRYYIQNVTVVDVGNSELATTAVCQPDLRAGGWIATWLRTKQTDPLTGARLPSKKLSENIVARQSIARWRDEHPGYTE
jgi:hypothetical protein